MTEPITNPTPKARFMQSQDNVSKHRIMVDTREFERACDFALMQYQARLSITLDENNPQAVLAVGLKMKGAVEFLSEFRMLGEVPKLPAPAQPRDNLNHALS